MKSPTKVHEIQLSMLPSKKGIPPGVHPDWNHSILLRLCAVDPIPPTIIRPPSFPSPLCLLLSLLDAPSTAHLPTSGPQVRPLGNALRMGVRSASQQPWHSASALPGVMLSLPASTVQRTVQEHGVDRVVEKLLGPPDG
ncbi:hypothetical protein DPEC_G00349770 [Dallia pectoralis]|uniref:Uncharacterized protein n=1 Tax=Dallia pectoralis TaxID=75939 RepID=A0ACC2F1J2_DALPE|nr:hypothetical protein DPEC_G00349770 [Dallia pectoralis]